VTEGFGTAAARHFLGGVTRRARALARGNPGFMLGAGLGLLGFFVAAALLANFIAPYDPNAVDYPSSLQAPSLLHLLGTDEHGRDLLSRLLFGAQISLFVAVASVLAGCLPGIILGLFTGYVGGWFDAAVSRVMDGLFAFPSILLAIGLMTVVGPGTGAVILAIAVASLPVATRVARSAMVAEMSADYVEASKALNSSTFYIIGRAILPNVGGSLLVLVSLSMAQALLAESALSFLGLGADPPTADWGAMLASGRRYLVQAPWYGIMPGIAILLSVIGVNLVAEGLQSGLLARKAG
jgi:ABC-type dipeptide/oligopeptide/nickel transport system permease subunit